MRGAWLLLLAGCNAVFGLDPTLALDDLDRDGIDDTLDNCVDVANVDQADGDGDGRGDACDHCDRCLPCDRGADHDEDGDLIPDGCDNCPALANANQANSDGDELGDVCDDSAAYDRRLLFDGFGTLGPDWLESGAQWDVVGDDVAPEQSIASIKTLEHSTLKIPGGRWVVEVGLVPPPADRVQGVYARDATWCKVDHAASGAWQLVAGATRGQPFTLPPGDTIRLRMMPAGLMVACEIPQVATLTDTMYELDLPFNPRLWVFGEGMRFRYIDVTSE